MTDPIVGKVKSEFSDPIPKFVQIRTDSIELFKDAVRENTIDDTMDGHDVLVNAAAKAIDHALSSALTEVQDNFLGFVSKAEMTEGEDVVHVDLRVKANLTAAYFDAVSS